MTHPAIEAAGIAALEGLQDRKDIKSVLQDIRYTDEELWQEIVEETGRAAVLAALRHESVREPSEMMLSKRFPFTRAFVTEYIDALIAEIEATL